MLNDLQMEENAADTNIGVGAGCAVNFVDNVLQVSKRTGGTVTITGNTIGGDLQCVDNEGTVTVGNNTVNLIVTNKCPPDKP